MRGGIAAGEREMKFKADGLEFNATVSEASESPSPQTGDPLRTLTIQFRAQKTAMHEQALEAAQQRQSGGLFSLDDVDQPELEWRVRESSSQYVGSEPWGINHHVWRIEQVERLACERLILGSVELEPYEYAEEVSEERVIRLVARSPVTEAQLDALSKLEAIAPVTRVGISDTSRPMNIQYLWGERPEGLGVVVRCVDAGQQQLTPGGAALSDDALGDLISVLSAKGVLDDTDMARLRQRRHQARHVESIDRWRL
jgi:hypothetical protein